MACYLFFLAIISLDAAESKALLDRWLAGQTNLKTWSADIIQTRTLKVLSQPLVSTGQVWVAMPDRFRWELGQPAQTIAVRQSNQLWIIYPRLKRAEKYPLGETKPGPWRDALALLEASFPRHQADLESRFQVLAVKQTNHLAQVILQPKSATARRFMTEIQVIIDIRNFSLAATELRFSDGSRLRNDFENVVMNAPLNPSLFEVKVPPEYTIVEPLRP